jgi:hypothetical protein
MDAGDELLPAAVEVLMETGHGLGFHAPAAAEVRLFARGPSGGSDGGAGNCRAV